MVDKAQILRDLHRGPNILVLPNAWDAISARIFEAEGFPAVATTSAGVANALGYADGGAVPPREMFEAVPRIARAGALPGAADPRPPDRPAATPPPPHPPPPAP